MLALTFWVLTPAPSPKGPRQGETGDCPSFPSLQILVFLCSSPPVRPPTAAGRGSRKVLPACGLLLSASVQARGRRDIEGSALVANAQNSPGSWTVAPPAEISITRSECRRDQAHYDRPRAVVLYKSTCCSSGRRVPPELQANLPTALLLEWTLLNAMPERIIPRGRL